MGWFEGLLTGYNDRRYEVEKEQAALAEQAARREEATYTALLNSKNPEIRAMAGTGLLQLGQPRKKKGGFAGWMGEMESSPIYPELLKYASTPQWQEEEIDDAPVHGQPPPPTGTIPTPPPATGSAAMPATSQTQAGAPPLTPVTPPPPPPFPIWTPGGGLSASQAAMSARTGPLAGRGPSTMQPSPAAPPMQPSGTPVSNAAPPPAPLFPELQGVRFGGGGAPTVAPAAGPAAAAPAAAPVAGPPPVPPGPPAQTGLPAAGAPATAAPAATLGPPPSPPQTTSLSPSRPPRPRRTSLTLRTPEIFPTAADLVSQKEQAEVTGLISGWQEIYKRKGDPDWEQKGIDAALMDKHSRGGSGYNLMKGAITRDSTGQYWQEMIDGRSGEVVTRVKATAPGTTGGGAVDARETIAFQLFGKEGEDPNATIRRLTPFQMGRVIERERIEKGLTAAEVAMRRADAMANAPLSAQSKNMLTETLSTKWMHLQEPMKKLERNFNEMVVGLRQFKAGERVASVETIRVAFEKMIDPDSVVREGEYNRQANGLGLLQRMEGIIQQYAAGGGNIPEDALAGMVETARQLMAAMNGVHEDQRQRIENRAQQNGIDPAYIFGGSVASTTGPPKPLDTANPVANPGANPANPGATTTATDDWNKPLRYDPATRRYVPQ